AESLKPVLNKVLAYQLVDAKEQNAKPSLKQGPAIQNLEVQNSENQNPAIQNIEPWNGASR
ncbi:MAG: hypothetical protein SVC26_08190, partial [Pseudomonadota bacterium]|nr:hypothetical protein [Pseudomonadota bacterium]